MKTQYVRIPLAVDAIFNTDGSFRPRNLYYHDSVLEITRILGIRRHCPRTVSCIAPMEYTVIINGMERRIYFEEDTNTWFSVKEVVIEDEGQGDPAQ